MSRRTKDEDFDTKIDILQHRCRLALFSHQIHDQDVPSHGDGMRHAHARLFGARKIAKLLLGPGGDDGTLGAPHIPKPGIAVHVVLHGIEVARRYAVDLQGQLPFADDRLEDVRFLAGADRAAQRVDHALAGKTVKVHEGALIKDGLLDSSIIRVFYPGAKNIDLGIEVLVLGTPAHVVPLRNPLRCSQSTWGPVYLQTTSAFSFWNSQGMMMTTSPSLIQILFFILPGIRAMRVTPSMPLTFIRLDPSKLSI